MVVISKYKFDLIYIGYTKSYQFSSNFILILGQTRLIYYDDTANSGWSWTISSRWLYLLSGTDKST